MVSLGTCCLFDHPVPILDEWDNFMERINCKEDSEIYDNEESTLQLRHWVSLRGQTLCGTGTLCVIINLKTSLPLYVLVTNISFAVRGMMYYRRALKLQAFLDMASESGKWKFYSSSMLNLGEGSSLFCILIRF